MLPPRGRKPAARALRQRARHRGHRVTAFSARGAGHHQHRGGGADPQFDPVGQPVERQMHAHRHPLGQSDPLEGRGDARQQLLPGAAVVLILIIPIPSAELQSTRSGWIAYCFRRRHILWPNLGLLCGATPRIVASPYSDPPVTRNTLDGDKRRAYTPINRISFGEHYND